MHAPGAQFVPHWHSQHEDGAFAGFSGVLPAKLVAVSVNKSPEINTNSFFMFVYKKIVKNDVGKVN